MLAQDAEELELSRSSAERSRAKGPGFPPSRTAPHCKEWYYIVQSNMEESNGVLPELPQSPISSPRGLVDP
eukprot:9169776-Karenia_brevis.AAC.1